MEKPEKMNLSHIVSERIKGYILDNGLSEGDKLPSEKQLIESLGVSRTVVRESLKLLEMLGFLKIKTGDGIYVDSVSFKAVLDQMSFRLRKNETKMKELLATRRILELGAVELAIERYDPVLIDQMDQWNDAMEIKINQRQIPLEEDLRFHRSLFKATDNDTYFEFSELLSEFFISVRELHFSNVDDTRQSLIEHRNIVKFIRAKDTDSAKREMEQHLVPLKRYFGK